MRLSDFDYVLPKDYIAQEGVEPRDAARMLVLEGDGTVEHLRVFDLPDILSSGDVLVLNESRVLRARVRGRKPTGGRVELLFLEMDEVPEVECLVGGRRLSEGSLVVLGEGDLDVRLTESLGEGRFRVELPDGLGARDVMDRWGEMPTPPYIRERLEDQDRYQTTFARVDGSVAAPTAGLHFTQGLLSALDQVGVEVVRLVLHVGYGTFRPIHEVHIEDHVMETEHVDIGPDVAGALNDAVADGRRVIAVGTTTVRALETATGEDGTVRPLTGPTDLFIHPPYRFRFPYSGLLTNFHLPCSTLLMLVATYAGRERVLDSYEEAKAEGYRFYSLGDAMFIDGGPVG